MNQQKGLRSAEIETFYRGRTGFLETERPQKNSVFIENPSKYWKPKPILKKNKISACKLQVEKVKFQDVNIEKRSNYAIQLFVLRDRYCEINGGLF